MRKGRRESAALSVDVSVELESELAKELKVTSTIGYAAHLRLRVWVDEGAIRVGAGRCDARIRPAEAGMIQGVLRVGAHFKFRFFEQTEGLAEGEVEVAVIRTVKRIAMQVSEYTKSACGYILRNVGDLA